MRRRKHVVFLQLPLIDNDPRGAGENLPLASAYLRHALARSDERRFFTASLVVADGLDDAGLLKRILASKPDVLACTLYLWNVERTLAILEMAARELPSVPVIVGGPEVARDHPFLFRSRAIDAAVIGEGEPVFAAVLRGLRTGRPADFQNVGRRVGARWRWGRAEPPRVALRDMLPPLSSRLVRPDARGMAYLETTRGCPLRCTYCCYNQQRAGVSCLTPAEVAARVAALRAAGAGEIRFIDPTFNANPRFDDIVTALAEVNRTRRLKFFAELRPDRISRAQATALARAGFAEIEVGVQCRNENVLRLIRRPLDFAATERGVRHLSEAGIQVTLDLMYGLPGQRVTDVKRSVEWAVGRRRVRVQCMQTLLLPGTELRASRRRHGMVAGDVPPYAVSATAAMSAAQLRRAEEFVEARLESSYDCPTRRFVGRRLPDLFPGGHSGNRRVMFIRSRDFFAERNAIRERIRDAVRCEPHIAWQFVLEMAREEPLDVLDGLIDELAAHPPLVLDRFLGSRFAALRASRRLFVRLKATGRFSRSWIGAAEELLRARFF